MFISTSIFFPFGNLSFGKIIGSDQKLHVSWVLASQNYRLITRLPNTKQTLNYELAPNCVKPRLPAAFMQISTLTIHSTELQTVKLKPILRKTVPFLSDKVDCFLLQVKPQRITKCLCKLVEPKV